MKGLVFTDVLTYGGSILALVRPFWGLLIYVCFAIIKPDALWAYSVPQGMYSRIVAVALLVGWALGGFGNWRLGRAAAPCIALVAYTGWMTVSAFAASNQAVAWSLTEASVKTAIPLLVGVSLVDSLAKLRQLAWVIVLSQGLLAVEFNISYYQGLNSLVTLGFAGMDDKSVAITMVVGASLALFVGLQTNRAIARLVAFGLAALMIHVPLFTYSRGGMLALLASGGIALWVVPKRPVHLLVLACTFVVAFRLAGPEVRSRFATSFASEEERDDSAQSRIELWGQAWEALRMKPVLGLGPGQWAAWSQSAYGWKSQKAVHNTWLQTGAELGFPGVLALGSFFGILIVRLVPFVRGRRVDVSRDECDIARMAICSIGGYLVGSQFITLYGVEIPYFAAFLGVCLLKLRSDRQIVDITSPARDEIRSRSTGRYAAVGAGHLRQRVIARR